MTGAPDGTGGVLPSDRPALSAVKKRWDAGGSKVAALHRAGLGRRPFRRRASIEATVVVALLLAVSSLSSGPLRGTPGPFVPESVVLPLAAAELAVAGAVLAVVVGSGYGQRWTWWLAGALGVYGLLIIHLSVVSPLADSLSNPTTMVQISGLLVGLGVLAAVASIRPGPSVLPRRWPWRVMAMVALTALGIVALLSPLGNGVGWLAAAVPIAAIAAGGSSIALVLLAVGWRSGSLSLWRISLGLAALAAAYLWHRVPLWASADAMPAFEVTRLVALVVVLAGILRLLRDGNERREEHERMLLTEVSQARRLARMQQERDHELRNAVSGLSALVPLLSTSGTPSGSAGEPLSAVAESELSRIGRLLDKGVEAGPTRTFAVAPVVRRAVVTHGPGSRVVLEMADDLCARGSEATLTHVMVNVLANCARHAAGSPVVIAGRRHEDRVLIEVTDEGPQDDAPAPRVELPARAQGIGLDVARRLLEQQEARLDLVAPGTGRGCSVVVDLPAPS